jgi:hypothetical protein
MANGSNVDPAGDGKMRTTKGTYSTTGIAPARSTFVSMTMLA